MNASRYSLPAIALHWAQAGLVFGLIWLGWHMTDLPKGAERSAAYGLHKSLGLLVLGMSIIRLAWRCWQPPPPLQVTGRAARLAGGVHLVLYAFLLLAPLSGYLASAFTPYAMKFFGLELPRLFARDEDLNALFKQAHYFLVWGGALVIALHLLGVVRHLASRDGTLRRMLPGRDVH